MGTTSEVTRSEAEFDSDFRNCLPVHSSPRPELKRKRTQSFDAIVEDCVIVISPSAGSKSQRLDDVSYRSTGSTTASVLSNSERDEAIWLRRTMLRELGVSDSVPMHQVLEIPDDYFWNDQHPHECTCHWCNVLRQSSVLVVE